MGTYRLSEEAKDDLIGIHQYGVRQHGEAKADAYFWQIIERLEVLGEPPPALPGSAGNSRRIPAQRLRGAFNQLQAGWR